MIILGWLVVGLGSGMLLPLALPGIDVSYVRALGQIALALLAAIVAVRIGWRTIEPQGGRVRDARLLVPPVLFAALPLAAGARLESWPMFLFLTAMELMLVYGAVLLWRAPRPASARAATLERLG